MRSIICLISCKDKEGVISKITDFIQTNKGNIISLHQYVDRENGMFFMRIKWSVKTLKLSIDEIRLLFKNLLHHDPNSKINLFKNSDRPNMAIMCSKDKHCLMDILSRHKLSEFNIEIPLIISNHKSVESIAKLFNIPFYYLSPEDYKEIGNDGDLYNQLGSLSRKHLIEAIGAGKKDYIKKETIKSYRLETLLQRNHIEGIDLLHMDVEGAEYAILKDVNLEKVDPQIILLEHKHLFYRDVFQFITSDFTIV